MKWIIPILLLTLIGVANATTIGQCTNTSHIVFNTTLTVDGVRTSAVSDPIQCNGMCITSGTDIGDVCTKINDVNWGIFVIWLFVWAFLIAFYKWYGRYKLVPTFAMFVNTFAGLLVTPHVLMVMPILIMLLVVGWTVKKEMGQHYGKEAV